MNLEWATDGTPYKYRLATRYEIPCTVSGTVSIDGKSYRFDAVAGQRDHSWGVRDWWSMDWVWSALHLDDGTHVHGVNIRIPAFRASASVMSRIPRGSVIELDSVNYPGSIRRQRVTAGRDTESWIQRSSPPTLRCKGMRRFV